MKVIATYGIVSKGNGEAWIIPEGHTSLSIGGGQAGQGYPCVMVIKDDGDSDGKEILRVARG